MLDYTVSIESLLRAILYCVLKGYCVLDYNVSIERFLRAMSIERLLRARLYLVY